MYDQACRLIHHQQIVLIYYIQRDIFGDNLQFPAWAIHHDRNHIQRFHPVITFHRLIVHQDATRLSRQLDAVTGSAHHTVYQELIHPEQGLPLVRYEAEMLIHLARRCFVFFRHQHLQASSISSKNSSIPLKPVFYITIQWFYRNTIQSQ